MVIPLVTVQRPFSPGAPKRVLRVDAAAFTVAKGNLIPKATVATAKHSAAGDDGGGVLRFKL